MSALADWANAHPDFQTLARLREVADFPTFLWPLRDGVWVLDNQPDCSGQGMESAKLKLGFPDFEITQVLHLESNGQWTSTQPILLKHTYSFQETPK